MRQPDVDSATRAIGERVGGRERGIRHAPGDRGMQIGIAEQETHKRREAPCGSRNLRSEQERVDPGALAAVLAGASLVEAGIIPRKVANEPEITKHPESPGRIPSAEPAATRVSQREVLGNVRIPSKEFPTISGLRRRSSGEQGQSENQKNETTHRHLTVFPGYQFPGYQSDATERLRGCFRQALSPRTRAHDSTLAGLVAQPRHVGRAIGN